MLALHVAASEIAQQARLNSARKLQEWRLPQDCRTGTSCHLEPVLPGDVLVLAACNADPNEPELAWLYIPYAHVRFLRIDRVDLPELHLTETHAFTSIAGVRLGGEITASIRASARRKGTLQRAFPGVDLSLLVPQWNVSGRQ
ncbi:hypothetical protein [Streptomyces sp. NPDC059828]|uniref:hypothetical protein n=1 Tax=Streptomyces sp. NPDC059828 TaxID=3346965 RepID=UPI0036574264